MQIEWSEGEVLRLAGVSTEAEEGACEGMEARMAIRKRCDREGEVGTGSGAGRTGTGRGEPCGGFIGETVKILDLVKKLPAGSLVYRARQQKKGQRLHTPYDFAPPPVDKAVRSNRMSPAGLVMFYGSDDPETAQLEIDDDPKVGIAVGTFRTIREATVLDLTKLPRRLGFFERQSDSSEINRYALAFLHSFVKSVAAKVESGNREHIDYVPTQVVTEWFRTVFRFGKSSLDGIVYPSTQNPGGHSVVLFATRCDVTLTAAELKAAAIAEKTEEWMLRSDHEKAWLKMVRMRAVRDAV